MTNEKWTPVPIVPYNIKYLVSNLGKVKSIDRQVNYRQKTSKIIAKRIYPGRLLKQSTSVEGYKFVALKIDGKTKQIYVHRLVAMAFVDGYDDGLVVNHKNENKADNRYTNLEWCTQKYNANYGTRNERMRKSLIEAKKGNRHANTI